MDYQEAVEFLAREILAVTDQYADLPTNTDVFVEDLRDNLRHRTNQLAGSNEFFARPHVQIEYDRTFYGGDYSGDSNTLLISMAHINAVTHVLPDDADDDAAIKWIMKEEYKIDPVHLVHYTFDDVYDSLGEEIKE